MKLSYFDLLSPEPVCVTNIGRIVSPKLKDISAIGYSTYQFYLTILLIDSKKYFSMIGHEEDFDLLSDEEKLKLNVFDLLIATEYSSNLLRDALNFFIKEDVIYSNQNKCFIIQNENENVGIITKESYPKVCDLICQRVCVKHNQEEDFSKVKNKKALEIMKKLQKGRTKRERQTKDDKNMELGNIISAVANKSKSLNILNIWDLTVFQLWDCFSRISNNNIYDIQARAVAAWGNKDNYFDATAWFKRIDNEDN